MSLWRYIGEAYYHAFPYDHSQWPPPPAPLHSRFSRVAYALGFLRVPEGGYYTLDGRWTWAFWKPDEVDREWRYPTWWERARADFPPIRYLLTGRGPTIR